MLECGSIDMLNRTWFFRLRFGFFIETAHNVIIPFCKIIFRPIKVQTYFLKFLQKNQDVSIFLALIILIFTRNLIFVELPFKFICFSMLSNQYYCTVHFQSILQEIVQQWHIVLNSTYHSDIIYYYKTMIFKEFVLIFLVLNLCFAQQSLIVTSHPQSNPVLDTDTLINHLVNNQKIRAVIVQATQTDDSDIIQLAKDIFIEASMDQDTVSSFLTDTSDLSQKLGDLVDRFEVVSKADLSDILAESPQTVVHFSRSRLLQDTAQQKSQLFLNMTPQILSGLLVGLFLLITLCIGVSCLSEIKTNDKFARTNLWVGKQS